mmetsp:Transcript_18127/g.44997  ORF Transcript_18127/g.44997 Transcript_18127/m.44997 type:complete len:232 (-) Transcript_18127:1214-1909(-)
MSKRILKIFLGAKHERLHNRLHALFVACADEDQTEGEGGKGCHVERSQVVCNNRNEQFLHLFFLGSRVCQPKPHDGTDANRRILLIDALIQQPVRRVTVVTHVDVDEAHGEESPRHHLMLHAVQIVVHAGKAVLHVPQQHRAEAGSRRHLPVILVLEDPAYVGASPCSGTCAVASRLPLSTFGRREKLVVPKTSVHKGVYKRSSEIRTGAIDSGPSWCAPLHQMRLVDVLG